MLDVKLIPIEYMNWEIKIKITFRQFANNKRAYIQACRDGRPKCFVLDPLNIVNSCTTIRRTRISWIINVKHMYKCCWKKFINIGWWKIVEDHLILAVHMYNSAVFSYFIIVEKVKKILISKIILIIILTKRSINLM